MAIPRNEFIRFTSGPATDIPPLSAENLQFRARKADIGELHIDVPPEAIHDVIRDKQVAITHVYKTLDAIQLDLKNYFPKLADVFAPQLSGILLNPDGSPAAGLTVNADPPKYAADEIKANADLASVQWPAPHDITDARGGFRLQLPGVPVPKEGLILQVKGKEASDVVPLKRVLLLDGDIGTQILSKKLAPLSTSIVSQLKGIQSDILANSAKDVDTRPDEFAAPAPQLTLGQGDCARFFRSNSGVIDRFRYSTLIRLVEPQMNQWQPLFRIPIGQDNRKYVPFNLPATYDSFWTSTGAQNAIGQLQGLGKLVLVNRTAIDRPLDISAFHDQVEKHPVYLPKASTLGLGYVIHMQQVWIPAGLSLGDLVYSLPLAPGEQQRIAIEERVQTASERDMETFSEDEFQTFRETQDASALAVFRSAFDEAAAGGSHIDSRSNTGSGGATASTGIIGAIFGGGGVSAGYSSSSSSGNSSSWQNVSRDFASSSAQDMHSSLGRVAAGSRRSARTQIRVATATERVQVTTRVVTNHNKNHALTMQWWEVLRHFTVTSEVDDVQLVCFVPLELVQFLPEGAPFTLTTTPSRAGLLERYAMVLRYYDVLFPFFRFNPEYAYGMKQLKAFAANPEAQPQTSTLNSDVIRIQVHGTFLPFEELFVSIVGKSGARVGPVKLSAPSPNATIDLTPEKYATRDELLGKLKDARLNGASSTLVAEVPLPDWLARSDIVRFDLSRRFASLSYKLKALPITLTSVFDAINAHQVQSVSLAPTDLERELGGPVVRDATASLKANPAINFLSALSVSAGEQMAATQPLPAVRVAPVLAYSDLLRIEAVFHHIVRNTVSYSKAVWSALTDEERAILLERYTIGVPAGGVTSADQEVPLLNCVSNRVLGFFGNAAIMPFSIPPQVAASMEVTSRDVQDALLRFHRQSFQPPRSSITLPAKGTLGEAVLGACASAEKIDLTRFWNWQDSPSDTADAIPPSVFQPAQSLLAGSGSAVAGAGVAASAGGTGGPGSIISIANTPASTPSTSLLEKLIDKSPDLAQKIDVTGLDTLQKQVAADTQSAAAGRKEAIDSVTNIQTQAMKSAEGIVKSVADAAASIYGGGGAAKKDDKPKDDKPAGGGNE